MGDVYGIYVRISDDRVGAGLGVKRQAEDCQALAESNGLTVGRVYTDNDLSAFSGRIRPDYRQMLADIKAGILKGVLAWHTDRLHRSPLELEEFIDVAESAHLDIRTVKAGPVDLSTPSGRMVARQLCAVARYESEHKSDRITRKMAQNAADGKPHGGIRPYGFEADKVTLRQPEAKVIRECARRALSGASLHSIVRWLGEQGHRSATGRPWSQQALRAMLISGRIAGLREHHRQVVGKAVWPAIIKPEQHEILRARLTANKRAGDPAPVRKHHLTGLVFGTCCAAKRVKMSAGVHLEPGRLRYSCLVSHGGCGGRAILLAPLVAMVDALIIDTLSDPQTLAMLANREADTTERTAELLAAIEQDEHRLTTLTASLEDGDEEELPEVIAAVRGVRRRLDANRATLAGLTSMPVAESLPDLAARWPDLDVARKAELARLFIRRVLVAPARRGLGQFDPSRVTIEWA